MHFLADTFRAHPTFASLVQALFVIYAICIAIRILIFLAREVGYQKWPVEKLLAVKKYLTLECSVYALICGYGTFELLRFFNWVVCLID